MDVMDWREREQLHEHISMLTAEVARLRLTDAEREAVKRAAGFVEELAHPETSLTAAALRELLERLK